MLILLLFYLVVCLNTVSAQQINYNQLKIGEESPPSIEKLMGIREELRYKIKYGFFTVGWVDVFIAQDSVIDGRRAWLLKSRVTSNSSIPFVEQDTAMFNSWMVQNDSIFYSDEFWYDDVNDNKFRQDVYKFDREKNLVYQYHLEQPDDSLKLYEPASSGHIMFFFTRLFAGTNKHLEAPIYVDRGLGKIIMDFTTRIEKKKIEAFETQVNAYYSEGTSTITGPFGLSGNFKAWFATDEYRIPLETHLKVFLGNVKVKLIEYKRTTIEE